MGITSFEFLIFVGVTAILYYLVPKKVQWIILFLASILFYCLAATPYTIIYLFVTTVMAYVATLLGVKKHQENGKIRRFPLAITIIVILLNLLIWFFVNGKGLWRPIAEVFIKYFYITEIDKLINMNLLAAMGMGYYTLQIIGYIIDCYWENVKPQKNFLKLFLFTSYFPQLTTGPISRYEDLSVLYDMHVFKYQNIAFGAQRILWGFIKKIVLAERIGILVSAITVDPKAYIGFYSWMVILLYPLQIYADFSGCMDIVLGVSEIFDIHLTENFKNPFFSRTSQEFWQRWHITLGTWVKDYVLYPLLKSNLMIKLGKKTKKKYGKKISKYFVNFLGMFVLWMVIGAWHGAWKHIVGVSLWYWIILMLGELLGPIYKNVNHVLNIKTENFSWHMFQSMRTYLIYAIGATFFNVGIFDGLRLLKDALKVIIVKNYANPWIFFDGSIIDLGMTYTDINIIIVVMFMILIVGILREKYGYARYWIANQGIMFRWIIWIGLFLFVLIWGEYGPGYNASLFIYQGF